MSNHSFGKKLEGAYGPRLKVNGLIKRLDPILDAAEFNRLVRGYLVDTTKPNYISPAEVEALLPPKIDYEDLVMQRKAPLRPGENQHYIPFGDNLWFFGMANSPIITAGIDPLSLSEEERLALITREWIETTKHLKKKAHHLVASLDPRFCNRLVQAGYPADAVVISSLADAMQVLTSRFYPGESLGMICGVHHDRSHIHAHFLVHPKTDTGRRVNMTTDGNQRIAGTKYRVPYQQVLKQAYAEAVNEVCGALFPNARMQEKREKRIKTAALEDLILVRRCVLDPLFLIDEIVPPTPPAFKITRIREQLLSDPNYLDIICLARRAQVQNTPHRLKDVGRQYIVHNFKAISESLEAAIDPVITAGDDLFLNAKALRNPEFAIGPFHHPGIGHALSRSGWASKQGIKNPSRPAEQVARRIDRMKAKLKVCRQANQALVAAASDLELAFEQRYAWAVQTAGVLLAGAGAWQNKMEPYLSEWQPPTGGESRLLPRQNVIDSINTELGVICRRISERYRVATLGDLEPFSKVNTSKLGDGPNAKPDDKKVEQFKSPLGHQYAPDRNIDEIDDADKDVASPYAEIPGPISDDIDFDNPLLHIAAKCRGSLLGDPLRVQLGDLLDMTQKKIGDQFPEPGI